MNIAHLEVNVQHKLEGFSLDVNWKAGNELVVLFGYSGSGKSMTLDAMAGLLEPDNGRIQCGDRVFLDSARGFIMRAWKRRMGYVFQKGALFPHMTVRENIAYGISDPGNTEVTVRANETMQTFGVEHLAKRYPRDISGGQAQRVALARAIVGRPELLLLDEPFAALDAPVRLQMRELLLEIRRSYNIPIVMVTHDLEEALTLADRIMVYSGGRVVQSGVPQEIMQNRRDADIIELFHPAKKDLSIAFN